jgi:flagellar basal body-associated protein FliL
MDLSSLPAQTPAGAGPRTVSSRPGKRPVSKRSSVVMIIVLVIALAAVGVGVFLLVTADPASAAPASDSPTTSQVASAIAPPLSL